MREKAKNRIVSDETRRILSDVCRGSRNGFYGKSHSADTRHLLGIKCVKRGIDNGSYVNLDNIRDDIIYQYNRTKNYSEVTRHVNKLGVICSRTAIKRRLYEWGVISK